MSQNHTQRMQEAGVAATRGANVYYAPPESFKIVTDPAHHLFDPSFNENEISAAVIQSIDEQGVQTPVEVMVDGTTLNVVFGRGRITHCKLANKARAARGEEPRKVPYLIFKGTEQDARDRITYENFHRKTMKPSDYADRIVNLRKGGASDERIATLLNVPARMLPQYEAVSELSAKVRKSLDAKTLPMAAVATLRALSKEEQDARLSEFEEAVGSGKSKQAALTEKVKRKKREKTWKIDVTHSRGEWHAKERVRGGKGAKESGEDLGKALAALGCGLQQRVEDAETLAAEKGK